MLKVKAKLESDTPLEEPIIVDVPKEYTNRQMVDYLKQVLFGHVMNKSRVKFEVLE